MMAFSLNYSAPAHAERKVATLTLEGEITDESVAELRKGIDEANQNNAPAIILEINSPGGDVDAGYLLAKSIERSKAPVTCVVDGNAASMASFILESCTTRVVTRRSIIMIHEPAFITNGFGGQFVRWQNTADHLRYMTKAMMEHYAKRMGMKTEDLINRVYGGRSWFMSPEEALKFHVVDFVVDSYEDIFPKIN